jgi:undecaprenyl-diphosphatase
MRNLIVSLKELDQRIVIDLVLQRKRSIDRSMILLTMLGDGKLWIALALIVLFVDKEVLLFYRLAIGLLMEVSIYKVLKNVCSRPRPFQRFESISCLLQPPDLYSFPSGHTAAAFVVAILIGSFYGMLLFPFLVLASLIGFSRIYLGAHYPSDVLAGAVLGSCCAELVRWWIV